MKTLQDYVEDAIKLNACASGIKYAQQFNTLEEFVNSDLKSNVDWFFRNCKVEDEVYYLLKDKNYAIQLASAYGHVEVVKLLLKDKRVDHSAKNYGG